MPVPTKEEFQANVKKLDEAMRRLHEIMNHNNASQLSSDKQKEKNIHHEKSISFCLLLFLYSGLVSADSLNCPCKVVKITDGDTVHVLDKARVKHKIRLMGIDAPERKQTFGTKSKQNLSNLIAGKFIEVEYNKRDRYGRIIGKLLLNGQDINLQQVKQGFAWHYKHYLKEQSKLDRVLYSSAEIEARNKHIGLWVVPAVAPWDYRKAKRK